jgi:carbamoyltransferase
MQRWALGIGGSAHDFSAALMRGRDIRVAIEAERVTRRKHGGPRLLRDPFEECIAYCLDFCGIEQADVSSVVSSDLLPPRSIQEWGIETYPHHLCHAASAVMMLEPGTDACVLVYDGSGSGREAAARQLPGREHVELEVETFSAFCFRGNTLEKIGGTWGPREVERLGIYASCKNSVGQMYEMISEVLGFHPLEVGKTMGLAAWGRPRFKQFLQEHMTIGEELGSVFSFDPYDRDFQHALDQLLDDEQHSFAVKADLAASAQEVLTEVLLAFYGMVEHLDFDVLCVAGGCALNSVANGRLASQLDGRRRLVIPPCAGDSGIALGSLWLKAQEDGPSAVSIRGGPMESGIARPGPTYSVRPGAAMVEERLDRLTVDPTVDGSRELAGLLAEGLVIGVFNGASEIGPRALGGRSILADPRRIDLKERINRRIKRREPFRPLAPLVLAAAFDDYFQPAGAANPFMLVVAEVKPEGRKIAPGVVHVDGTARVQVVDADGDPFLWELLNAFGAITGLPMLLNTSFNGPGEPIVESPRDALEGFLSLGLDGLWLENHFLRPPERGFG